MNVHSGIADATTYRRELIVALRKLRQGDFSVRMSETGSDADLEVAMLFNEVVGLNQQISEEFDAENDEWVDQGVSIYRRK